MQLSYSKLDKIKNSNMELIFDKVILARSKNSPAAESKNARSKTEIVFKAFAAYLFKVSL